MCHPLRHLLIPELLGAERLKTCRSIDQSMDLSIHPPVRLSIRHVSLSVCLEKEAEREMERSLLQGSGGAAVSRAHPCPR